MDRGVRSIPPSENRIHTSLLLGLRQALHCDLSDAISALLNGNDDSSILTTILTIPITYLNRALVHSKLGYNDLASSDAYRAGLGVDRAREILLEREGNDGIEEGKRERSFAGGKDEEEGGATDIDEIAFEFLRRRLLEEIFPGGTSLSSASHSLSNPELVTSACITRPSHFIRVLDYLERISLANLINYLVSVGCLIDAERYCKQGLSKFSESLSFYSANFEELLHGTEQKIYGPDGYKVERRRLKKTGVLKGSSRREVYAWNHYEPDRFHPKTLEDINKRMKDCCVGIADGEKPWCEARVVELPVLALNGHTKAVLSTTRQLGVFALRSIPSSLPHPYISEFSPIIASTSKTVTPSSLVSLPFRCDFCTAPLPDPEDNPEDITYCPECEENDVVTPFCSKECLSNAQSLYHTPESLCGTDWEWLHRDIHSSGGRSNPPSGPENSEFGYDGSKDENNVEYLRSVSSTNEDVEDDSAMYALLLLKTFGMAIKQNIHPLNLPEVKWLYGAGLRTEDSLHDENKPDLVDFSFHQNVVIPHMLLDALDIPLIPVPAFWDSEYEIGPDANCYSLNKLYKAPLSLTYLDTWVTLTLLNKFKSVASLSVRTTITNPNHPVNMAVTTVIPAVHPIYSLTNHNCDPNVYWAVLEAPMLGKPSSTGHPLESISGSLTKSGKMQFWVLSEKDKFWKHKVGKGEEALKEKITYLGPGDEIRSSYVNPGLPYWLRHRHMWGTLGGRCRCERCEREMGMVVKEGFINGY